MSRSSSRGFTLVEVLVALTLVSLLVAGAAALLVRASRVAQSARAQTTGTLLAMQTVESLRSNPQGPTPGHFTESLDTRGLPVSSSSLASVAYVRQWTVEDWAAGGASSGLMAVRVEVRTAADLVLAQLCAVVPRVGHP